MIGARLENWCLELGLTIHDIAPQTGMLEKQIEAAKNDDHGAYVTEKHHLKRLLMLYARKVQLELKSLDIKFIDSAKKSSDLKSVDHAVPAFLQNKGVQKWHHPKNKLSPTGSPPTTPTISKHR